ncbi:hypothetical protein [Ammoniphilus sp. 3BR4]|uniref:hypothetical protein n=1 Tax=Ammoniphilus sp. 3BR4 TaxID=3158265 RepID=UPI0034668AF4
MKKSIGNFNAKLRKRESDTHVLGQASLQRNREELPGKESLMKEGRLEEAAAVFTHEGLQVFSKLFTNSIENAIDSRLAVVVEQAVEKKLAEVLEVAAVKIRQFMEQIDQQQQAVDMNLNRESNRDKEDNEPWPRKLSLIINPSITGKIERTETEETVEPLSEQLFNKRKQESAKKGSNLEIEEVEIPDNENNQVIRMTVPEQADLVAQYLRENGKMKAKELVNAIDTIPWGNNPWNKLHYYCQINMQIKKVGKGYYDYSDSVELGGNMISGENDQKPE